MQLQVKERPKGRLHLKILKSFEKPNNAFTFLQEYNTSVIEIFIICKSFALGTVPGTRATKITYQRIINWEKKDYHSSSHQLFIIIHESNKDYSPDSIKITFVNRHSTTGKRGYWNKNHTPLLCLWAAPKWALWGLSTQEMHCGCRPACHSASLTPDWRHAPVCHCSCKLRQLLQRSLLWLCMPSSHESKIWFQFP